MQSITYSISPRGNLSEKQQRKSNAPAVENLSDVSNGFADGWEGFRRAGAGQTPRHREGTATERKRHIALTLDPRLRPRGGTESVDLPAAPFRGGPCRPTSTPSLTSSRSYHRVQCTHAGKGGGFAGRAPHCWWWVRWSSSSLASLLVEYQARTLTTWPRIWRPRPRTWRPWRRTNLHNLVFLNHVLQSRRIQ